MSPPTANPCPSVRSPSESPEPAGGTNKAHHGEASSILPAITPSRSLSGQPESGKHGETRRNPIRQGVTSLPFLLERMGHHLRSTRQQPLTDIDLDLSTCADSCSQQEINAAEGYAFLIQEQEVHFLELFWQTHYFSYPILNEAQIRSEHRALWADHDPTKPRRPSPLIDIILALCIQLGSLYLDDGGGDSCSSLAGLQYYRQCEEYLDQTIEGPSITTVQCYIFSVVYMYEAGLLNTAQVVAGQAIMMAMMQGLCNEPSSTEAEPQREVTRRKWWSLYILDAKLSMEVGRPPLLGPSHSTCEMPSDSNEVAQWLGPHYSFDDTCPTWLGFQTQTLGLLNAVRQVRAAFYNKYEQVVGEHGYREFVENATAREECAAILTEQMKALDAWAEQLPSGYMLPRRDGQPYSTDRSPMDIQADIIIHCQRQRLLLELQYHQYRMSFYQPFITFAATSMVSSPLSDTKATAALNHAMTFTDLVHQAHTTSMVLGGVHHVLRWQVHALFIMMAFVYAFPLSSSIPVARRAVDLAIAVIEGYGSGMPRARRVAAIARALGEDMDAFTKSLHSNRGGRTLFPSSRAWPSSSSSSSSSGFPGPIYAPTLQLGSSSLPLVEGVGKQMLPYSPMSTNMMDMDFLNNFQVEEDGEVGMDMMWANSGLEPNNVAYAAPWAMVPPGDNVVDRSM